MTDGDRDRSGRVTDSIPIDHLERMTDAFYALDDEWRFTYLNERAEEVLGRDREAILGAVVWEAFPAAVGTRLESAYREAIETGEQRDFEFEYPPLDADFEVHAYPSDMGLSVYFRDITERKRRDRRLEELSERLQLAVEGGDVGVWDWDLRTDEVRFDERWAGMLGHDLSEIEFDLAEWEDRVHPDDLGAAWDELEAHFAGETDHYQFDHRMRAKGGDWIWVRDRGRVFERDEDGSPLRMVGIHIDVTEEKERKRELERTSARLEALYEGSPDMIDIHDENGTIIDANRVMAAKLGYDRDELVGMDVWAIDEELGPDDAVDLWRSLEIDETLRLETTYRRADGSSFPAEVHVRRVDVQGEDRYLASSRDISERKAYQQRIERENERLDEFASVVSHDLRNPLNVLSGYLQLARETGNESYFDRCERALGDMGRLIEDVLALARQGDAVDSPTPVALDEFASRYERDPFGAALLASETDGSEDDEPIDVAVEAEGTALAEPARLRRLIENLLRNTAEHGGDRVVIGDLSDGFYVADDGPGIPETQRVEVFESGYTTSDSGTGFGLAIVKRIAEAHGWDVSLTESESGGARFEFRGVERP